MFNSGWLPMMIATMSGNHTLNQTAVKEASANLPYTVNQGFAIWGLAAIVSFVMGVILAVLYERHINKKQFK